MPKIVPSNEVQSSEDRKSPMHRILVGTETHYWIARQVAAHLGVSLASVRRAVTAKREDGTKVLKAPSHALTSGKVKVWLYDMGDVQELEQHFSSIGYQVDRKVDPKKTLGEQIPEEL